MPVQISVLNFFRSIMRSGISGSYDRHIFKLLRNLILFSIVAETNIIWHIDYNLKIIKKEMKERRKEGNKLKTCELFSFWSKLF